MWLTITGMSLLLPSTLYYPRWLSNVQKMDQNAASALAEAGEGWAAHGAVGSRDRLAPDQGKPCPCETRRETLVAQQGRQGRSRRAPRAAKAPGTQFTF